MTKDPILIAVGKIEAHLRCGRYFEAENVIRLLALKDPEPETLPPEIVDPGGISISWLLRDRGWGERVTAALERYGMVFVRDLPCCLDYLECVSNVSDASIEAMKEALLEHGVTHEIRKQVCRRDWR